MLRLSTKLALLGILGGSFCVPGISLAEEVEGQQPPVPVVLEPLRLEEIPPMPASITYQNGTLTIAAQNATLSDVLRAACGQTGTEIEIPPSADERVVGVWGPGPVRDVLASFLNGSHFNYVMLGSNVDSTTVTRLILSAKTRERASDRNGIQNTGPVAPNPARSLTAQQDMVQLQESRPTDIATGDERTDVATGDERTETNFGSMGGGIANERDGVEPSSDSTNSPGQGFEGDGNAPATRRLHRVPHHHRR
jgi:hypothetical protein